jgi:parallel beta-helix repeat protein
VVYGRSRAELLNNFFEANGFGINITQQSQPLVRGNRIVGNKDGVVIQDNSQPIFRQNSIERNQRDGLVLVGQASVNLGKYADPGGNILRNNQRYNLNNTTNNQEIFAYGNELSLTQNRGKINIKNAEYNANNDPQKVEIEISGLPVNSPRSMGDDPRENIRLGEELERDNSRNLPRTNPRRSTSLIESLRSGAPSNLEPIVNEPNDNESNDLGPDSLPSSGLLPVPNVRIPIRSRATISGSRRRRPIWQSSAGTPPPPLAVSGLRQENEPLSQSLPVSSTPANLGLRYRVVVEIASDNIESMVRKIVPQAFRSVVNGRDVMQAGAFREWSGAYRLLQRLRLNGLSAEIEPI